ncbi:MAG TPA: UDP-N-acetylmuramoyl-tripeptide--D-alanyl-D-alanine ligase [Polyangiaceae bacterium]|nr:UDP-N-acetylmuramoyl-tripeptide--D-alanyl-D-alanine ligase [Polyangiaceae bacterium]
MATPIPPNRARFTLEEVLSATGGRVLRAPAEATDAAVSDAAGPVQAVSCVVTDTRSLVAGALFVALRGERFDGHDFLSQAIAGGASLLLIDEVAAAASTARWPIDVVVVRDTLVALGDLAAWHCERWGGQIVGVGGSAGKTTTKGVSARLLEALAPGAVWATPGNLNNRIGVPMTLLALAEQHRIAVIEMGTNQPGEMAELSRIVRPDAALLTLIDLEHTEGLGDLDGVEREEAGLFEHLRPTGVAIGYRGDERVARQLELRSVGVRRLAYDLAPGAYAELLERHTEPSGETRLRVRLGERELTVESRLLGRAGALAVLGGLCACEALFPGRIDGPLASRALSDAGEPGRSQLLRLRGELLVLDDTYNSNPASVENSLATGSELAQSTGGRLWLVLGAMLELGSLSQAAHEHLGDACRASGAVALWGIAGDAQYLVRRAQERGLEAYFHADVSGVAEALVPRLAAGDVVVVKASRGVRAERVVAELVERIGLATPVSATSQAQGRPDAGQAPGRLE